MELKSKKKKPLPVSHCQALDGDLLQFWTGNPSNDIWHGHLLINPKDSLSDKKGNFSKYLCCPLIPTHIHIIELCEFIEPYQKSIDKVRVLKSSEPNFYIVALKMMGELEAEEFVRHYQRRKFNQIEADLCEVYQLLGAQIKSEKNGAAESNSDEEESQIDTSSFRFHNTLPNAAAQDLDQIKQRLQSPEVLFSPSHLEDDGPQQSNCPICLEALHQNSPKGGATSLIKGTSQLKMKSEKIRGGENDFNLTILCCHTFHWMCLKNWNDTTCPLCRYLQSPTDSSQCDECGTSDNLWVCLICGHIGCFNVQALQNQRQHHQQNPIEAEPTILLEGQGHSMNHYEETKHTYAMEVETQNVWDFCKQNYVHRLIQNQFDGKLIEFGDPLDSELTNQRLYQDRDHASADSDGRASASQDQSQATLQMSQSHDRTVLPDSLNEASQLNPSQEKEFMVDSVHRYNKKIESLNYEYNHMLAQTLENQRAYFERRLQELNMEEDHIINMKKAQLIESEAKLEGLEAEAESLNASISEEKVTFLNLKADFGQALTALFQVDSDYKKIKKVNEDISAQIVNQVDDLKRAIEECEREIAEIKLDRTDLMNHIKMSQKCKKAKNSGEISQSQTLIFDTGTSASGSKKGSRKK